MYEAPYREGCVYIHTPPCKIQTVYVRGTLQGGLCGLRNCRALAQHTACCAMLVVSERARELASERASVFCDSLVGYSLHCRVHSTACLTQGNADGRRLDTPSKLSIYP